MKLRTLAFAASAAALSVSLSACNSGKSESVKVDSNAADDVKMAYILGSQFGAQTYTVETEQLEFKMDEAEFYAALEDGFKMVTDTAFKIKHPDSVMASIAQSMNTRARSIMMAKMPQFKQDSTDTVTVKAPKKPGPMPSEMIKDASYLLGVQFGAQFASIKQQSGAEMNLEAYKQGVRDARARAADTTIQLKLLPDTLQAVSQRLRDKIMEERKALMEKQKAEEEAVKNAIEPLKGDTLADGTQAKLNFAVKATGISVSAENLQAYAGKPLFVFYFSTTCGHCRHATPEVKEIASQFKEIKSIAIASGGNSKRDVRSYIDEFKLDEAGIDVFFDESREFGELYSDGYVPKVYVVKADGSLMTFKNFEAQKDSIKAELGKLK